MTFARLSSALGSLLLATSAAVAQSPSRADSLPAIDELHLLGDISALAADSMEGRRAGTPGGARARAFLVREFMRIGLAPLVKGYQSQFSARSPFYTSDPAVRPLTPPSRPNNGFGDKRTRPMMAGDTFPEAQRPLVYGTNLLGIVKGTAHPERYIVVSAHYDHLGVRNGAIYPGADDNASGSAALIGIAQWTIAHPPQNSIVFAWFDGEESGLLGSKSFVERNVVPLDRIIADVNLDMVSRSVSGELNVIGARHWPVMQPLIDSLAKVSLVTLRQAHEGGPESDDWTHRSDMGPFADKGIPFVSFDVDESVDYHRPSDVVEHIQPLFYYRSVRTIAEFLRRLDIALDGVARVRQGR